MKVPLLGSVAALYLGIVLYLFSIIGIGLMISSPAVTQQQGLLGAFPFIVPAVILFGFATPIANMPPAGSGSGAHQSDASFHDHRWQRLSGGSSREVIIEVPASLRKMIISSTLSILVKFGKR